MNYLIGLLTFILFLDCLLLMLLILVQLPKKEAGMGTAFGGGATDALFGAGAGNALTKLTKWAAGVFLGLALILSMLNSTTGKKQSNVREFLTDDGAAPVVAPATGTPAASNAVTVPAITNVVPAFGAAAGSTNAVTNTVETVTVVTNAAATNVAPVNSLLQSLTNAANTVSNEASKAVEGIKKEIPKVPAKK